MDDCYLLVKCRKVERISYLGICSAFLCAVSQILTYIKRYGYIFSSINYDFGVLGNLVLLTESRQCRLASIPVTLILDKVSQIKELAYK